MRFKLGLTSNSEPVPFDHLHRLTGALHKWLGAANPEHDGPSLYSFSWLSGGKTLSDGALTFEQGASWFLSFHDVATGRRALGGILSDPEVTSGMRVFDVQEQAAPEFGGCSRFKVAGPVMARARREGGGREYLLWNDRRADEVLTRVLRYKLDFAGFGEEHQTATVHFDRLYSGARSKLVTIKGISHRASLCPVVVTGTPAAVEFAWNVGVGELTGSGLGALW